MNVFEVKLQNRHGKVRKVSLKVETINDVYAILNNPKERAWNMIELNERLFGPNAITQVF